MRQDKLVSVIIPFYNTDIRFMQEAVDSVIRQTYEHWELLLVDDGSDLESTACAKHYAEQHPGKIQYLEHPGHQNLGISPTCQLGITRAKGTYIALLDSDDVWLPQKLAQQVAIMDAQPEVGMLYGRAKYWHSWTGLEEDLDRDYVPALGLEAGSLMQPPRFTTLILEGKIMVPCPCSIMVRADTARIAGGFDSLANMYSDQRFYAKVGLIAGVMAANDCWDLYRQHPASICATEKNNEQEWRSAFLLWARDHLQDSGTNNADLLQALRRQLWLHRQPSMPFPRATRQTLRWLKKWCLNLEKALFPASVRRWFWT